MTIANRINPRGSGLYLTFESPSDFLATLGGRQNPCTAIFHPRYNPTNRVDPSGLKGLLILKARHNHAWIEFVNSDSHGNPVGTKHSWGLFNSGLLQDYEIENGYAAEAAYMAYLNDTEERELFKYIKNSKSNWALCNNCAGWAADAWLSGVGGKPFSCTGTIQSGIRNPTSLISNIRDRQLGRGPSDILPNVEQIQIQQGAENQFLSAFGMLFWSTFGVTKSLEYLSIDFNRWRDAKNSR